MEWVGTFEQVAPNKRKKDRSLTFAWTSTKLAQTKTKLDSKKFLGGGTRTMTCCWAIS
jgi:hypothetical protein